MTFLNVPDFQRSGRSITASPLLLNCIQTRSDLLVTRRFEAGHYRTSRLRLSKFNKKDLYWLISVLSRCLASSLCFYIISTLQCCKTHCWHLCCSQISAYFKLHSSFFLLPCSLMQPTFFPSPSHASHSIQAFILSSSPPTSRPWELLPWFLSLLGFHSAMMGHWSLIAK